MIILGWTIWGLACAWTVFWFINFLVNLFSPDPLAQPVDALVLLPPKIKGLISSLYVVGMTVALAVIVIWNISKFHLLWFVPIWHFFGTTWIGVIYEQRVLHKRRIEKNKIAKSKRPTKSNK